MSERPLTLTSSRWSDFPWSPRRYPFFYGWVIVVVTTLGTLASLPGQTIGVGVFTDSFMAVLGLTRKQLALAYMLGTIGSSLLLPWAGSWVDRWGTRVMVTVSSLGLGTSLLLLSRIDVGPRFIRGIPGLIAWVAFGFLLIRFFGQGCLTMVSRVTLGRWFERRWGLDTAISNVAVAYGFNATPALLNVGVEVWGWQKTYVFLAMVVGGGMTLVGSQSSETGSTVTYVFT